VITLAACSSSNGKSSESTHPATNAPTNPVPAVTAALNKLTSVHLDTDTGSTKGTADVQMSNGEVTGLHVTTSQNNVPYETITTGGKTYLKLTTPVDGKNWAEVSSDSSIPQVKIAASPLSNVSVTTLLASPGSVTTLLNAATPTGSTEETLNGEHVVHWTMQVAPSKIDATTPIGQLFALLGKDSIPTDLWVNDHDQPVKLAFAINLLGDKKNITVLLSNFNAPLTITAPDPSDVTTK
jgi:hypothetical protein